MLFTKFDCRIFIRNKDGVVSVTYNGLTYPAVKRFSQTQILTMLSICSNKEQVLCILNAVTK
jgi:hypothetical protein